MNKLLITLAAVVVGVPITNGVGANSQSEQYYDINNLQRVPLYFSQDTKDMIEHLNEKIIKDGKTEVSERITKFLSDHKYITDDMTYAEYIGKPLSVIFTQAEKQAMFRNFVIRLIEVTKCILSNSENDAQDNSIVLKNILPAFEAFIYIAREDMPKQKEQVDTIRKLYEFELNKWYSLNIKQNLRYLTLLRSTVIEHLIKQDGYNLTDILWYIAHELGTTVDSLYENKDNTGYQNPMGLTYEEISQQLGR